MIDNENRNFWYWERGKFMNRRFLMQELYQHFLVYKTLKPVTLMNDPFWEPADEMLLGTANVFLQALAFNLDFDDRIPILNYDGTEEGFISVAICPSSSNGRIMSSENFVDNPKYLLTRTFHFLINISEIELHNPKYILGIKVRYRIFKDEKLLETETYKETIRPKINYNKVISFARISEEHLDYFENGYITFRIYVNQGDSVLENVTSDRKLSVRKSDNRRLSVIPVTDTSEEISKLKSDMTIMSKKLERLEKRDHQLKMLCEDFQSKGSNNYERFYQSVCALVFGGDNNSSYSIGKENIMDNHSSNNRSLKPNGRYNPVRKSNPQVREPIKEEEFRDKKARIRSANSDDVTGSMTCSMM